MINLLKSELKEVINKVVMRLQQGCHEVVMRLRFNKKKSGNFLPHFPLSKMNF